MPHPDFIAAKQFTRASGAPAGGIITRLKKSDIVKIEPMTISVVPEGMDKALTPAELRGLMIYSLTERVMAASRK